MSVNLNNLSRRFRRSVRSEGGFSMLPAITAVFVGSLISMGAWTAVNTDISLQQTDRYEKRAFTAAEAGLADYVQRLSADTSYWSYCDAPPNNANPGAVNDTDFGTAAHPTRRWLPASTDQTLQYQYTIDLLPTNGYTSCKASSDRTATMVNQTNGTFRVRITGRAGPPIPNTATINPDPANPTNFVAPTVASIEQWRQLRWKRRSIVADFRRRGFLDFSYFTDKEGMDPALYSNPTWAGTNCSMAFAGTNGRWKNTGCTEIQFASSDAIKGPFHTNDSIFVNGATFGNLGKNDRIEISATDNTDPNTGCAFRNYAQSGCGTNTGTYNGTLATGPDNAPVLSLPQANDDLATYGDPANGGLTYYGATKIALNSNGTMNVTNAGTNGGVQTTVPYPTNGVIYVAQNTGCTTFDAQHNYWFPPACGSVEVSGTYNQPLTIAAKNDIVITHNVIALSTAPNAVLGLIANDFVRVRHYVNNDSSGTVPNAPGGCTNTSGQTPVSEIDAAIMALQHSFVVDDYMCGSGLGTLKVVGGLTQAFRGAVGYGSSGYIKNYNYDYRLRYLAPPYFLTPALSGWRISRFREQSPACSCAIGG